jgi:hypothetical protein
VPAIQPDTVAHAAQTIIPWVEVAKAAAWPVAALLIAILLREPLGRFLDGIGSRITKLSAFQVELELAASATPASGPLLAEIREPGAANVGDSSLALREAVKDTTPADYAAIFIGEGEEWLTSRLFVAAAMLERMRGVHCFVFIERRPPIGRQFLALVSPSFVRWHLARRYPWLELAYSTAVEEAMAVAAANATPTVPPVPPTPIPQRVPQTLRLIISNEGAFEPTVASGVIGRYIASLQSYAPPADLSTWVEFANDPKWERAQWVTRGLLEDLLPHTAFDQWIRDDREGNSAKRLKAVLARESDFVAVVDEEHRFKRLMNRRLYLDELAKRYEG